jgi:hypothetical protein
MNKLKAFTESDTNKSDHTKGDKSEYKDRKKLGIDITKGIIADMKDWIPFFLAHKKKDDLADSFLQGIWFLQNKYGLIINY